MKRQLATILSLAWIFVVAMTGCNGSSGPSASSAGEIDSIPSSQTASAADEGHADIPSSDATELVVRFGEGGEPFTMQLEDNSTAQAIAGYVGTTSWQLPIYNFDESDVMQYYDIPSRYEIPDNSETVTEAHAGDAFYSDPNRIILYYHDAQISEEYTKIGTFDATDAFITAVEENPVLEGWGNKLVFISTEE